MGTAPFELIFEFPALSEDLEDAIAGCFDALIATHSEVTTVTLSAEGDTCLLAASSAIDGLRTLGANPLRLVDDLVSRGEIARRAGVTPQAVGLWIRGERHAGTAFPRRFVTAGGGLWLWAEVVPALAERGVAIDDGVQYPTRRDAQLIGAEIAAMSLATPT
ncbi:helix-turn-helix domain-containing protein [Pengzhenrongella sp.]|jgi:hypothetical protein|uniref:helix-turn-helix domain-containing protein n=1 Tax=Pengzhenrongella sp. TaxID=2888820 RepID=UPI002F91D256